MAAKVLAIPAPAMHGAVKLDCPMQTSAASRTLQLGLGQCPRLFEKRYFSRLGFAKNEQGLGIQTHSLKSAKIASANHQFCPARALAAAAILELLFSALLAFEGGFRLRHSQKRPRRSSSSGAFALLFSEKPHWRDRYHLPTRDPEPPPSRRPRSSAPTTTVGITRQHSQR